MPENPPGTNGVASAVPSMLDLVRLSPRLLFPPGGVDLYRQIALLTDMAPGQEVLVVACGKGITVEYFVREHGVRGSGVDVDPRVVELAEARARAEGLGANLQFQTGHSDSLPYRDGIFDVAVGELGLAAHADPAEAVRELVRVTKPGGAVALVQLAWKAPVDDARRHILSEHLGAHPLMAVEWKRLLKSSGIEEVFTADWSDEETVGEGAKPFFDFTEIFTFSEKAGILRRAWRRWGLKGVRTVLAREGEVHRLLNRERLLRLDLLKGRKPAGANGAGESAAPAEARSGDVRPPGGSAPSGRHVAEEGASPSPRPTELEPRKPMKPARRRQPKERSGRGERAGPKRGETAGLPLFQEGQEGRGRHEGHEGHKGHEPEDGEGG